MEEVSKILYYAVLCFLTGLCGITACYGQEKESGVKVEIEQYHPQLDAIINPSAKAEVLGEGFDWTEGPLWIGEHQMLLFSDIPKNNIHFRWVDRKCPITILSIKIHIGVSFGFYPFGRMGFPLFYQLY